MKCFENVIVRLLFMYSSFHGCGMIGEDVVYLPCLCYMVEFLTQINVYLGLYDYDIASSDIAIFIKPKKD